jgi:hypothetical protein
MFNCYTHGWTSRTDVCPACHSTVSTTSTTVNLPFLYIAPESKDAEIARLRAALDEIRQRGSKVASDIASEALKK